MLRHSFGGILSSHLDCSSISLLEYMRQCGPVVRALALRSGYRGFKACSDHCFNLFLVVPGSTSQLHL